MIPTEPMGTPTPAQLRDLALRVAREAAHLVREHRSTGVEVAGTKTSQVDVVTAADRASEQHVASALAAARPGDQLLGEEGLDRPGDSGVRWIVDPVDGTVNLLYGIPSYAVSIGVEAAGEPVAGVVVNAATGTEYAAARGAGATRDGHPIGVRPVAPLAQQLVLTGFSYDAAVRAEQGRAVASLLPRVRDIRRLGACSLDLCHLAEGLADAYVERGTQPWDHAAGGVVLAEAGGRLETLAHAAGGGVQVAAPAAGWEVFREAVVEAGFLG